MPQLRVGPPETVALRRGCRRATRATAILAIKTVHSIAFLIIQTCILYLVYKGLRRQSARNAALAAAVAIGESAVYTANGFRCPLTDFAERLGSEHGAVTDIFLPRWLAANVARIYTPLLLWAMVMHAGNLLQRRRRSPTPGRPLS
jgi:hypothetical protein